MVYLQVLAGFVLLLGGGEYLVKGSVALARRLGVSSMLIGVTLVGFGTSTPELVASLSAALKGAPALAIGNVVGSNIANIFLVLGLSALILPIAVAHREAFYRDAGAFVIATFLLVLAMLAGVIDRLMGAAGIVLLIAYTVYTYRADVASNDAAAQMHAEEAETFDTPDMGLWAALGLALISMAAILMGANLLVDGAIDIARAFGVSEAVIGLTLVAVGTSLPELVTSVMAALRKHSDVAFGNIIGSGIFNILGILGITALVTPMAVPSEIAAFDVWVAALAAILLVVFAMTGWRIGRREGGVLVGLYVLYLAALLTPGLRAWIGGA